MSQEVVPSKTRLNEAAVNSTPVSPLRHMEPGEEALVSFVGEEMPAADTISTPEVDCGLDGSDWQSSQ